MSQENTTDVMVKSQEIALGENGDIQARTMQELHRASAALVRGGILPKQYDTAEKVMTAIILAKELGLKPLSALKNIAVINGSASIWGELPLGIVRNSGLLEKINEFTIDKDYKEINFANKNLDAEVFAAVCIIKRRNEEERSFHYTSIDASKNPNISSQVWKSYRSIMMKRRARSIALKDVFGDLLGGVPIAEYDFDVIPSYTETVVNRRTGSAETQSKVSDINAMLREIPPLPIPSQE